jgi:hypothetical protein
MSANSKLKQSRNSWKEKSINNGATARYLRRELGRVKKERNLYKKEALEMKKILEQKKDPTSR